MKNPGIHLRLVLAAFILISATTVTLGAVGVRGIQKFVLGRFEERIAYLAKYLALNAELGILIDERWMLHQLAENLLSERDVIGVTILNRQGETLTTVRKNRTEPFSVMEKPVTITAFREEGDALLWDMEPAGESDFIGTVQIAYSTAGIDKLLSRMKYQFVWLAALLTVFSLLFFSIIARSLVAPLTRLVETIRNVTGGEWTARVTPGNLPETRELSIAFNAMLDSLERSRTALEKADREVFQKRTLAELGKFSLMVAHEVKNPLGIIKSSLDMLGQEESPESRELLTAYMNDEIRRLNRLIEDFLQFARPAAPNFRSVDINAVLSDCLDRFEIQWDEPKVRIRRVIPESSCRIIADPDLLVRAFGNILKNAVEAGGEGGEVDIEAEVRSEGSDRFWCLAIRDRGEGIDPENLERIFEPFFTTRSKGTGLGLAFTAQVVHSHGGEITAENRENGGAVFRVRLPVGRMRITDAGSFPVESPAG